MGYLGMILVLLAGCASISTGVISTAPDTYMIAIDSSRADATALLYREANAFCAEQKKQVITINLTISHRIPYVRNANSTLRFRCSSPADPALVPK